MFYCYFYYFLIAIGLFSFIIFDLHICTYVQYNTDRKLIHFNILCRAMFNNLRYYVILYFVFYTVYVNSFIIIICYSTYYHSYNNFRWYAKKM